MRKITCQNCGKEEYPLLKFVAFHIGAYCHHCNYRDAESNWVKIENLPKVSDLKKEIMTRAIGSLDHINDAKNILTEEGHFFDSTDVRNRTVAYSHLLSMISLLGWHNETT